MTISTAPPSTQPLLLNVSNATLHITPEQFDLLCLDNPDLRLELTKNRELIVMPPTGGESGKKNGDLSGQVWYWNRQTQLGEMFDSSTGYNFTAMGGGIMSPDVSWIERSRWEALSVQQRKKFLPLAPDFVIELRSETDNLSTLQSKMQEYRDMGVRLGWLINPQERTVEIYRLVQETGTERSRSVEVIQSPVSLSGEAVLPGFVLDLSAIW
jgi:Uma2 family endonuclease